ncbi:MAG: HlyD family efflux transporter periplasmic adaptor subunit [Bryobacterales bacterium]|nr:HlyD family efflux transporter periplasmic adaptor subunit [Bryobacterales bacterium]
MLFLHSNRKWVLGIASVAVLALGVSGVTLFRHEAKKPEPKTAAPPPEPALSSGSDVNYTGLINARELLLVPAPVEGTMESVEVQPGQEVFEGQLLGRIRNEGLDGVMTVSREQLEAVQSRVTNLESTLLAARLEASRAGADASRAQGEYDRASKIAMRQQLLYREGATPRLTFEKAEKDSENARAEAEGLRELARRAEEKVKNLGADIEAARKSLEEREKALEAAQNDLSAAEIHSPVDGVVLAVRLKAGDPVDAGMEDLFQLSANPLRLKVVIEPEPPVLAKLHVPMPAAVMVAELPLTSVEGEVAEIKDGRVTVNFDAPDASVKAGLTATVRIKIP